MRSAILALAALAAAVALDAPPASAQSYQVYPWCAQYGGRGATNCYFSNLWQCRQAISGNGGTCYQNPLYGYGAAQPQPRERGRAWRD